MMKFGLILLAFIFFITIIITMALTLKSTKNTKDVLTYDFLFTSLIFRKIFNQSELAKKSNGPFLKEDTLVTIKNGSHIINLKGNIFGEIKDYDSKPRW